MSKTRAVFLDRDGVINNEIGYLHKINDFKFIDGVFDSCRHFIACGYKIIIVTNQSGIGRRYYSQSDFNVLTKWMLEKFAQNGVKILDVVFCPHTPKSKCNCRKPNPGMFTFARDKYLIDMESSWAIGDKESDVEGANSSGVTNTILVRTGHKIDESNSNAKFIVNSIKDTKQLITR